MKHGASRYRKYRCRCDVCTDDHRERAARESARRRDMTRDNGGVAPVPQHNRDTYKNWACRCGPCTADHSRSVADWKLARR